MKKVFVKILRKIWNIVPSSLKIFLKPFIINIVKMLYALFGVQFLPQPIGKVGVPLFTRPLMKRSFAQQGEDLMEEIVNYYQLKSLLSKKLNRVI